MKIKLNVHFYEKKDANISIQHSSNFLKPEVELKKLLQM